MAELNNGNSPDCDSSHLKAIWNASHLLTLGLVNRFFRNYSRYREKSWNYADRKQLLSICYDLEHKIYAYENRHSTHGISSLTPGHHISDLVLRQQIYERFEQLHHQLLYRDPEEIERIILLIDYQLALWNPIEAVCPPNSRDLIKSTQSLSHIEILIQDKLKQRTD